MDPQDIIPRRAVHVGSKGRYRPASAGSTGRVSRERSNRGGVALAQSSRDSSPPQERSSPSAGGSRDTSPLQDKRGCLFSWRWQALHPVGYHCYSSARQPELGGGVQGGGMNRILRQDWCANAQTCYSKHTTSTQPHHRPQRNPQTSTNHPPQHPQCPRRQHLPLRVSLRQRAGPIRHLVLGGE